jgi:hypothetical protein
MEVHAMAYAYKRGTLIDNVIYYDYTIINRSANNYHAFRFALWDDIDLGFYLDDFIGFDSTWRLGIGYNGTEDDGGYGGPPVNSYGHSPPVTGVTMVYLPGDTGTSYIPAGAFVDYIYDSSALWNPWSDSVCYKFMHAIYPTGFPGPPFPPVGAIENSDSNYIYPGDPSNLSQASECVFNNTPGDRRFILASNDFSLNAGSSQHVVMALITTDTGAGGCPNVSFAGIRTVADTAWNAYYNPPIALHRSVPSGTANINTYPNPAHNILYVEDKLHNMDAATITIYNSMGQIIALPINRDGQRCELDVQSLPSGLYNAQYRNGNMQTNTRFLKD